MASLRGHLGETVVEMAGIDAVPEAVVGEELIAGPDHTSEIPRPDVESLNAGVQRDPPSSEPTPRQR